MQVSGGKFSREVEAKFMPRKGRKENVYNYLQLLLTGHCDLVHDDEGNIVEPNWIAMMTVLYIKVAILTPEGWGATIIIGGVVLVATALLGPFSLILLLGIPIAWSFMIRR